MQDAHLWWRRLSIGSACIYTLTANSSSYWEERDKSHTADLKPATDAVMLLRCLLLIVKLLSIVTDETAMSQFSAADMMLANQVIDTVWELTEKPLSHMRWRFDNVSSTKLADSGYGTAEDSPNTLQCCQLAAGIVHLVTAMVRFSLKRHDSVRDHCIVLKHLLRPEWGPPAAAARAELLESGLHKQAVPACHRCRCCSLP